MAIRLFVSARNIRASVDLNSLRVVAPAFRKATVSVTRPAYQTVVNYADLQAMTSYRNLISSVYFRDVNTTNVVLDPDTLNRYFRGNDGETVLVAEQSRFDLGKAVTEQTVLEELAALDVGKVFADTMGLTEVIDVLLIINRFFDEELEISETASLSVSKPFAETATLLEAHNTLVGKAASDSMSLTEDLDVEFGKGLFETPVITENLSRVVAFIRSFESSTSVSDDAVLLFGKNPSDAVTISEQTDFAFSKALSDTPIVTDSPSIDYSRPETDSLSVTESFSRVVTTVRDFTESVSMSDADTRTTNLGKSDSVALSQVFSRVVTFSRTFTDAFALDDAATVGALTKDTQSQKGNVFGVSDVFSRVFVASRVFTDSVSVSDDETISTSLGKSDSATVSEQAAIAFSTPESDSMSLSDAEAKQISKALDESVSITESLTFSKRSTASSLLNAGAINVAPINN